MVSPSGVSKTLILSSDPDELCNRLLLLLDKIIITRKASWKKF